MKLTEIIEALAFMIRNEGDLELPEDAIIRIKNREVEIL